jgi:translocation and assembly module TamB
VDYDVMFAFKNRLNKPDIIFDLQTEDQYMTTVLNAMPPEERIKQAINVLLLGYIVTPETKASGSKIISDHINQFWTQQLNSAADKSLGGVEVTVDIQTITDYSAGNAQDQTNFSYEVKKDIWNDRATVKVGGYVRTYTSSPQDATSRMIGDFSLEYKLNEKGNLYGKLFSQNKYEGILEGEIQRTGIGILYRQNYQSMSEIWERRKKRKNEKQNEK